MGKAGRAKPYTDHTGRLWPSKKDMCQHYGVKPHTFDRRRAAGWGLERSLMPEKQSMDPCTGPDGTRYPSVNAMCQAHGITRSTFDRRRKSGQPLKECLRPTKGRAVDHDGAEWPSTTAMCRHWGIDQRLYERLVRRGWSVERALTGYRSEGTVTGPDGHLYRSLRSLCQGMQISESTVNSHIYKGESVQDAIAAVCTKKWPGATAGPYKIIRCVQWPWFLCEDGKAVEVLLSVKQICELKQNGKEADVHE